MACVVPEFQKSARLKALADPVPEGVVGVLALAGPLVLGVQLKKSRAGGTNAWLTRLAIAAGGVAFHAGISDLGEAIVDLALAGAVCLELEVGEAA